MTSEAPSKPGRAARAAAFWALVLFVGFLLHGPLLVQRPRPLSRTEVALVSAAERALREGDEGFDYAAFFLKQEGAAGTPLEERWRSLAAAVDDASHPYGGPRLETAISSILLVLFRDAHLARYRREQAGLSGFLVDQQAGGNCEAQTKLLVASLRASRVALPEGTELGVEVFQDHAQAVLVSRRDRRLWNLLSGEQETAPRGDVYRPAILLSAYLRGLGLEVPVSDAKLLLLRGPRLASTGPGAAGPAPSFFTTSTLRLPASRARYAEGTPPEQTEVPFPLLRNEADGAAVVAMDKDVTFREAFVSGHDPRLLFPIDRVAGAFGLVGTTLVFRRQEDADRYQQAKTPAARRALLLDLAEAQIRSEIGSRPLELPPLERIAAVPLPALDELLARLQRIEWLLGLTEQAVDRVRSTAMVASALELRIAELSRTTRSLRQFSEDAGTEPELFLGRLGALDPARRRRLIAFFVPRLQSAHVRALAAALAEPGRVALSPRPDSAPSSGEARPTMASPEMEIELLEGPTGTGPAAPDLALPPGAGVPAAAVTSASPPPTVVPLAVVPLAAVPLDAAEPLPVSAFIDLVLSGLFSSGSGEEALPVLRRWDRAASAAVVHRAGDCDDTLARLRHAVKRPFEETSQRPPAHLLEAEKRLERACSRVAVRPTHSMRLAL